MEARGGGAQALLPRHLPFGQVFKHTKFSQLIFWSFPGTRGRSRHAREVQRHMPLVGDPVADRALEFGAQRQHGAENFADGCEVVVRDPLAQANEVLIEHWRRVEHADNVFGLDLGLAIVNSVTIPDKRC